jgi:hypothetical protein
MSKFICDYCERSFINKSNLENHKKTAKFCLELRQQQQNIDFHCQHCNKNFIRKDSCIRHELSCQTKIDYKIKYEDEIKKTDKLFKDNKILNEKITKLSYIERLYEEEKIKNKMLENDIKELASKAIDNIGSKTTNNYVNKNQILNNLIPLTNDYMKEQSQYFGLDYIKNGAQSMAKFAQDFTFKNRIAITDVSRKKFVFKDENGNLISDFNGINITDKFLETNKEVIIKSCHEYLCVLDLKMDMYKSKQDNERLDQAELDYVMTRRLLNTIENKDSPDSLKNMEKLKAEFVNHLLKMVKFIEKEEEKEYIDSD